MVRGCGFQQKSGNSSGSAYKLRNFKLGHGSDTSVRKPDSGRKNGSKIAVFSLFFERLRGLNR